MMTKLCNAVALAAVLLFSSNVFAQTDTTDFFELSLEDLMGLEVTSVSKKAERLQDVATSIYVITSDDIQRSGATRLADVLGMVPGTWFTFQNYNEVGFGLREGADDFSGSVLVLVDGVPYQSPYFSSFQFGDFDIPMEEIDRIEVIKGPGGTIYGANAATGIINIYTKRAEDAQGFRVTVDNTVRSQSYVAPSIRYGTKVGERTHVSGFGKAMVFEGFEPLSELDHRVDSVVVPISDSSSANFLQDTTVASRWRENYHPSTKFTAGLNVTSELNDKWDLTYNMFFNHHRSNTYFPAGDSLYYGLRKANRFVSRARLDYEISENHNLFINAFVNKESATAATGNTATTMTQLEIQDNITIGKNQLNIGANVRDVKFEIGPFGGETGINFVDPFSHELLWGVFVQDKFNISEKFYVMGGIKAETWTLIDEVPEISPSFRAAFMPNKKHTIWTAASRSVTTPGFINTNMELHVSDPIPAFLFPLGVIPGWPHVDQTPAGAGKPVVIANSSEIDQAEYLTGELGYRGVFNEMISFETSLFYTQATGRFGVSGLDWDRVAASRINPADTIVPIYYANTQKTTSYGAETVIKLKPTSWMSVELSHSMFVQDIEGLAIEEGGEIIEPPVLDQPYTPEHIIRFRTYFTSNNDWRISFNGMYATEYDNGAVFIWDQQRNTAVNGSDAGLGVKLNNPAPYFRLDFKIEKRFHGGNTSMYLWGQDITNDGFVMDFSSFKTGLPSQVHRLFGVGLSTRF